MALAAVLVLAACGGSDGGGGGGGDSDGGSDMDASMNMDDDGGGGGGGGGMDAGAPVSGDDRTGGMVSGCSDYGPAWAKLWAGTVPASSPKGVEVLAADQRMGTMGAYVLVAVHDADVDLGDGSTRDPGHYVVVLDESGMVEEVWDAPASSRGGIGMVALQGGGVALLADGNLVAIDGSGQKWSWSPASGMFVLNTISRSSEGALLTATGQAGTEIVDFGGTVGLQTGLPRDVGGVLSFDRDGTLLWAAFGEARSDGTGEKFSSAARLGDVTVAAKVDGSSTGELVFFESSGNLLSATYQPSLVSGGWNVTRLLSGSGGGSWFAIGHFYGDGVDFGDGTSHDTSGAVQGFVMMMSGMSSSPVWVHTFGQMGNTFVTHAAVERSDSRLWVGGTFEGTQDLGFGPWQVTGRKDIFSVALDLSNGNPLWGFALGSDDMGIGSAPASDDELRGMADLGGGAFLLGVLPGAGALQTGVPGGPSSVRTEARSGLLVGFGCRDAAGGGS